MSKKYPEKNSLSSDTKQEYGESTNIPSCMPLNTIMNIFNIRNLNIELSTLYAIETLLVLE